MTAGRDRKHERGAHPRGPEGEGGKRERTRSDDGEKRERTRSDEDRAALERALAGVRPLARGKARAPAPKPRPATPRRPPDQGQAGATLLADEDTGGFRRSDVPRTLLRELLRGDRKMGRDVDLHGLVAEAAIREVVRAVNSAMATGIRGLRIIHGQGRHSAGAPVLGKAVVEALCRPPLVRHVAALVAAPARLGGAGSTLVWLRRPRGGVRS